jgi:hypothetical protein
MRVFFTSLSSFTQYHGKIHLYLSNIITVSFFRGVVFSVFQQGSYLPHILKYLYIYIILIRNLLTFSRKQTVSFIRF